CELSISDNSTNTCHFRIEAARTFKFYFKTERKITIKNRLRDSPDEILRAASLFYNDFAPLSLPSNKPICNIIDIILPTSIYSNQLKSIQSNIKDSKSL
ncbi:10485_t:CDS:1, partial [Funneliformis geosporum]